MVSEINYMVFVYFLKCTWKINKTPNFINTFTCPKLSIKLKWMLGLRTCLVLVYDFLDFAIKFFGLYLNNTIILNSLLFRLIWRTWNMWNPWGWAQKQLRTYLSKYGFDNSCTRAPTNHPILVILLCVAFTP